MSSVELQPWSVRHFRAFLTNCPWSVQAIPLDMVTAAIGNPTDVLADSFIDRMKRRLPGFTTVKIQGSDELDLNGRTGMIFGKKFQEAPGMMIMLLHGQEVMALSVHPSMLTVVPVEEQYLTYDEIAKDLKKERRDNSAVFALLNSPDPSLPFLQKIDSFTANEIECIDCVRRLPEVRKALEAMASGYIPISYMRDRQLASGSDNS